MNVEPEPLSSLLARTPRPGTARAVRIATQLLDAARAGARLAGFSPERVLLAGDDLRVEGGGGDGAAYAAPEASLGEELDERADVYAIGVLLFEMLAGRLPFEGKSSKELVSAHLLREPPRLRELAPGVDESLEAVVMSALAKRREARPSLEAMRKALAELPAGALAESERAADADADADANADADADAGANADADAGGARREWTRKIDGGLSRPPESMPVPVRRPPFVVAFGIGAAVLGFMVLWFFFHPRSGGHVESMIPADRRTQGVDSLRRRGDLEAARTEAENLAKTFPRDAYAFAALGHVLFSQGEKERALAAYREALRLDEAIGASPELLANLRATFPDPQYGEAAFRLAESIGEAAQPVLSDLAATTREARLKRRAAEAIGRIRQGESR